MSTVRKQPLQHAAANENLQARYKPLGLRAVVAAMQCKQDEKAKETPRKRDIPAVLQSHHD